MRPTLTASDLFSSRGRVDVLHVLWGVDIPLTAADIARRTRMTHPAVSAILRSFTEQRLTRASPAGRGSTFWLERDNAYVETMLDPIFWAEREMPEMMTDALRGFFEGSAVAAILFGSYARGEQTIGSDVDVVVATADAAAKRRLQDNLPLMSATFAREFGATLSVIVYDRDEAGDLERRAPDLYNSLWHEGVHLFGSDLADWGDLGPK